MKYLSQPTLINTFYVHYWNSNNVNCFDKRNSDIVSTHEMKGYMWSLLTANRISELAWAVRLINVSNSSQLFLCSPYHTFGKFIEDGENSVVANYWGKKKDNVYTNYVCSHVH